MIHKKQKKIMREIRNTIAEIASLDGGNVKRFNVLKRKLHRLKARYEEAGGKPTDVPFNDHKNE